MIYILIIILLLFLSYHYDMVGNTKDRNLWYKIVLIILICLAGMRWRIGVDTSHGIYAFYHKNCLIQDYFRSYSLTEYPLWRFLSSFVYSIGGRFFWIQFIEAAFVNILVFKYIRKHSEYIFTCVLFYFIWMYRAYCFEEMKASFGIALCLFANDYLLDRKYLKSFLLYFIGFLFHPSIALVGLTSQMIFLRMNKTGVLFLLFGLILGIFMKDNFDEYLVFISIDDFIDSKIETYVEHDTLFGISDKSLFYYVVYFGQMLIYSICSFFYVKKFGRNSALLQLEPFLVITLFYVILNANINIFYRFVNVYALYMILFISQAFVDIIKNNKRSFSVLITSIIFSPLFLYIWSTYFGVTGHSPIYHRFYPYSSVIERKIDKERERVFNRSRVAPPPNVNEY